MTQFTERHDAILAAFERIYPGVEWNGIYCLVTGKLIGRILDDEFLALLDSLKDSAPEDCADDLAMRLFASMRPSMRWNKMRTDSLDIMRKSAPVETMAYLLNRLFAPINRNNSYVVEHGERIYLFNHLSQFTVDSKFESVLHQLLEIDAKLGCHAIAADFTARRLVSCNSLDLIANLIDIFHHKMMSRWEAEKAEARYMIANPLAKTAFFNSFMESKPPSRVQVIKSAKQAESRFFEALFEEITESVPTAIAKPKGFVPAAKLAIPKLANTKMPMRFGVKRQES